ncbi:DUF455 family protein [Leptospira wolffii]|uniref:Uncharacterized protein n=1 Tax=Leptospira wolffii TaxID=409998 RepID=A0A2M9ZE78_9LEPT|nr:DUF455 family protein [Leptospira wolffii]PJZ66750.1 hypothetical protein CH371_01190 [Leptospira wolffii]TGK61725.1 DUF455 family protein [Leptospira wolffii]TGK70268.1 DUF455 family protein [Leptospira wolffii]TGK77191.1 DUF455 family protein [Leptospira wolffii]TGL30956.1 DUF455 family protein [Leptospira wolffii]
MTLNEYADFLLRSGKIADKLYSPESMPEDIPEKNIIAPDRPVRDSKLQFSDHKSKMPRVEHLNNEENRVLSLHHFANHELMAVELFAWALLKFQDAPSSVRKSIYKTLLEEQKHLRLYLDSIRDWGMDLGDRPLNYIFWKQAPNMQSLQKFYAVMAISFEGANLDFSLIYRKAFEKFGDEKRAEIMDIVHEDEIRHVKRGVKVIFSEGVPASEQWDKYLSLLSHPFTPRRAKGSFYFPELRMRAGLSAEFADSLGKYRDDYEGTTNARIVKGILGFGES